KAKLEGLEVISAISYADIPFELDLPYVTEALRLKNFRIKDQKENKAGINAGMGVNAGSANFSAGVGSQARRGTEGEGLVVAYKLHMIDRKTYTKLESGTVPLELDKSVDFPKAHIAAKARLQMIEPGAGKSLPRSVLWACAQADAKSRDIVAAWVVDIKSMDPGRKSLTIAFPAFPHIEDCGSFSGIVYSSIDPVSDKINRQKLNIAIAEAELDDSLHPIKWDARISLVDESFNIRLVKPGDIGSTQERQSVTN
ncbi:MAG: hypothetical protein HQL08_14425, partial [Nitrospirae bacterium]|nr:hypothetical protein [Nitrospirota bacterium]